MSKNSRLMVNLKENTRNELKSFSDHNGLAESQAVNVIVTKFFNGKAEKQGFKVKETASTILLFVNFFMFMVVITLLII